MTEYIERDKAIDACFDGWNNNAHDCAENIRAIPAADVRPVVRAEFVCCGDGKSVPYMCTHCSKTVPANLVEIWGANFCPNCGADMREES